MTMNLTVFVDENFPQTEQLRGEIQRAINNLTPSILDGIERRVNVDINVRSDFNEYVLAILEVDLDQEKLVLLDLNACARSIAYAIQGIALRRTDQRVHAISVFAFPYVRIDNPEISLRSQMSNILGDLPLQFHFPFVGTATTSQYIRFAHTILVLNKQNRIKYSYVSRSLRRRSRKRGATSSASP